jgi:hypothetical protein
MSSRTFAPPPPLAVTIAGTSYALRFVDTLTVEGNPRHGWADVDRRELLVAMEADIGLNHVGRNVGEAVAEAMFQLCPEYGVEPHTCWRDDADVFVAGPECKAWLTGRLAGSLPEVAAATWPVVAQRPDGRWACPFCRLAFASVEDGLFGSNPTLEDHVKACGGPGVRFVRSRPYRAA